MQGYPVIDVHRTGLRLKEACEKQHRTAKDVQKFLGLAALQSVYGWFRGKTLPSLDNFYALSCYLGMRMEDMVVTKGEQGRVMEREAFQALQRRMMAYVAFCFEEEGKALLSVSASGTRSVGHKNVAQSRPL